MLEKKNVIGTNLRKFAIDNFGSISELANSLKIKPQSLHKYLTGERQPGAEMIVKLIGMGCDANWLLTGKKADLSKNDLLIIKTEIEHIKQKRSRLSQKISDFKVEFDELTVAIDDLDDKVNDI